MATARMARPSTRDRSPRRCEPERWQSLVQPSAGRVIRSRDTRRDRCRQTAARRRAPRREPRRKKLIGCGSDLLHREMLRRHVPNSAGRPGVRGDGSAVMTSRRVGGHDEIEVADSRCPPESRVPVARGAILAMCSTAVCGSYGPERLGPIASARRSTSTVATTRARRRSLSRTAAPPCRSPTPLSKARRRPRTSAAQNCDSLSGTTLTPPDGACQ